MPTTPRVIFTTLQNRSMVELEWILPVVAGFRDRGYHVDILFERHPCSPRIRMGLDWVSEYADIHFLDEFGPLRHFRRMIATVGNVHPVCAKALRVYTSWGHQHGSALGIQEWRYRRTLAQLLSWCEGASGIIAPAQKSPTARLSPAGIMFDFIRNSGQPVVWLRNDVNEIAVPDHRIDARQAFTVFSDAESDFLQAAGLKTIVTGALRFNQRWLEKVDAYFGAKQPDPNSFAPKGTPLALGIIKNEGSPVWRGRNFRSETEAFIRTILDKGYFLILKPHPNQDIELLKSICSGFNADRLAIDVRPLAFWVPRVDRVFGQLTSGALECPALGVPFEEIDLGGPSPKDEHVSRTTVKGDLDRWTVGDSLADSVAKERMDAFKEAFQPDIDPQIGIELCEAFLLDRSSGGRMA